MQAFIQLIQNEYIRFALVTGLVCMVLIAAWLLFRHIRLWYWKTETVLEALDSISSRLEHVEGKLAAAEQDALEISENIYAIGAISEEGKAFQQDISNDIKSSQNVQLQISTGITAVHEEIAEVHEEIAGVHELLADSFFSCQEVEAFQTARRERVNERGYEFYREPYQERVFAGDITDYDEDGDQALEYFWQGDPEEDFPEEDEDEIRKKIKL